MRLKELAASRVRYGYRRLHILLRSEGWAMNHNRTYRLYREEGLSIRPKVPRRKRAWRYRVGRPGPTAPNEVWTTDFKGEFRTGDGYYCYPLTLRDAFNLLVPSRVESWVNAGAANPSR